uniref:Sialin n=1 Tax=Hirondellea gigas TaxID=1518452 RepID=A0A6A7G258_9CRUS
MSDYGSNRSTNGEAGNPSRKAVLQSMIDTSLESSTDTLENALLLSSKTAHSGKFLGCLGVRHLVGFLGFLGFANVYAMRVNLSVAIVAMVNHTAIPHVNATSSDVCPVPDTNTTTDNPDGEFIWTETVQGTILGSFFWGYLLTNFLGGRLGELYGGRWVMGIGVMATGLLTVLSPIVARWSTTAFVVLRILEGMTEGVTFPAMNCMLARWVPPMERSRFTAMVFAGGTFGTVISMPLAGYLCANDWLGGWPSVFYLSGAVGVVWFIVWILLVADSPESHGFISTEERLFISSSLDNDGRAPYKAMPVPWRRVFTSPPFYAILVAHTAQNWGFYTLLTEMPSYLNNILHFDIKKNAMLSALPYLLMWVISITSGFIADWVRSSGRLSTTTTRKIFNSIGHYGPCVCLVIVGYTGCHALMSVAALTVAVGLNGAIFSGHAVSHLEIAPNFAGTLLGITNTVATIPGILGPTVVGYLTNGNETLGQWRIVFLIAAIIFAVGNTFYLFFYIGETQPWNQVITASKHDEDADEDEEVYSRIATEYAAADSNRSATPEIF